MTRGSTVSEEWNDLTVADGASPAAGTEERDFEALAGPLRLPGPAGAEGTAPFDQVATPLTQVIVRRIAAHRTAAAFLLSVTPCARRGPVPEYHLVTEAGDDGTPRMRVERATRD